jgi:hypothetical protein
MELFFKEGDFVSHQGFGNGVVISLAGENKYYPVVVDFNGYKSIFSLHGKQTPDQLYPSLLQGHDRFNPQPNTPIFQPQKGELVWANVCWGWCVLPYSYYNSELKVHLVGSDVAYCEAPNIRPFKGEIPVY